MSLELSLAQPNGLEMHLENALLPKRHQVLETKYIDLERRYKAALSNHRCDDKRQWQVPSYVSLAVSKVATADQEQERARLLDLMSWMSQSLQ